MAAAIRLLATDLDGTVAAAQSSDSALVELADEITALRSRFGMKWAVFSGRSKRRCLRLLSAFRHRGVFPDFLVIKQVYLYRRTRAGYVPCLRRNLVILWRLSRGLSASRHVLDDWYESNVNRLETMRTMIRSEHRLRMRFEKDEDAVKIAEVLDRIVQPFPHLRVFHAESEVDVMPVPYLKGLVLSELSRLLEVDRRDVLAIGNGRNDLSVIDTRVAAMCGCPANSDARVIQAVHEAGGHLAKKRSVAGVLEIITAHINGSVSSELPADWHPPRREMSVPEKPWAGRPTQKASVRFLILAVVAYLILLIFAGFDLLPYSDWIRKPYEWLLWVLVRIVK
jgi:hydroxymethylpyrimidine pyrophosphatase-like HAD family hydrolase